MQELHHNVEKFVRVMDDQVLLLDCSEAVATVIADAFRITRIVGHEFEIYQRIRAARGRAVYPIDDKLIAVLAEGLRRPPASRSASTGS